MTSLFASLLTLVTLLFALPAASLADVAYIPMAAGTNQDWNDVLEVDNTGSAGASFTITLYTAAGTQVYSSTHSVNAYEYKTILLKTLSSQAACGKVTYDDADLHFRMAYESVSAGGVAEFLLSDQTLTTALLLFSNFSTSTIWKGAAAMNTGSTSATLSVYAFGEGSYLGMDQHTLPPNGMLALTPDLLLPSLTPTMADTIERLVIVSTQGLSAITISGDATTSKLLFAPACACPGFTPPSGGGGGGDTPGGGALVGTWEDLGDPNDNAYWHFFSDGTYIWEDSSYTPYAGTDFQVYQPIFIHGTYSLSGDDLILQPQYCLDKSGGSIATSELDPCWQFTPHFTTMTFDGILVSESAFYLTAGGSAYTNTASPCSGTSLLVSVSSQTQFSSKVSSNPSLMMN